MSKLSLNKITKLSLKHLLREHVQNGDGQVTLADAVAIVNYLLGTPPASFKTVPADVTQNGFITISDAVAVVNMASE